MLKIKLARFGKKGQPHYRIVVTEARSKRDGKYTALLGHYAPTQTPKVLEIDMTSYNDWVAKGAQPTPTVAGLAKRFESGNPFPEKPARPSKKARAKTAAAAQEAATQEAVAQAETSAPEAAPTEDTAAETTKATQE